MKLSSIIMDGRTVFVNSDKLAQVDDFANELGELTHAASVICCAAYLRPQCRGCMAGAMSERLTEFLYKQCPNQGFPDKQDERLALIRQWAIFCKDEMEKMLKLPCSKDAQV